MTSHPRQTSKQFRRKTRYPAMVSYDTSASYRSASFNTPTHDSTYASRISRLIQGPIDYIRNNWPYTSSPAYHPLPFSPRDSQKPGWVQFAVSVICASRFRRYLVLYLILALIGWAGWVFLLSPRLQERANLSYSLDPSTEKAAGGWFGKNSMPQFDDLTHIATLDPGLLPVAREKVDKASARSSRRLVFVGDVHGCKEEREFFFGCMLRCC